MFSFQFQNGQRGRLLSTLRGQLSRPDIDEDQGEGIPALRQVRVHPAEVVHARHRLHLQQVSISPTFYEQLFYTKVFCAAFF